MRNGVYKVTFSTDTGVIGDGAWLVHRGKAVGASFGYWFSGTTKADGKLLNIALHFVRQDGHVPTFELAPAFDLVFAGEETPLGFTATAVIPGPSVAVVLTGWHLAD